MSDNDTAALVGLRRLVVHARDQLAGRTGKPRWNYTSEAWSPAQIEQFAAMQLAAQVLTLVADCLPADGSLSPDEAEQMRRKHERALKAASEANEQRQAEIKELTEKLGDAEAERDSAVDYQTAAEEEAENWRAQWKVAAELARTDAAAAVRYLIDPSEPVTDNNTPEQEPVGAQ